MFWYSKQEICIKWGNETSTCFTIYSMCSLVVSILDSLAVEPRSNHGSSKILMSENLKLNTTSPVVMC